MCARTLALFAQNSAQGSCLGHHLAVFIFLLLTDPWIALAGTGTMEALSMDAMLDYRLSGWLHALAFP